MGKAKRAKGSRRPTLYANAGRVTVYDGRAEPPEWDEREAWQRGCISEHDGLGGERSNRNAHLDRVLREAVSTYTQES